MRRRSLQENRWMILDKLSDVLDDKQRANKLRNLLHTMANRDKTIAKSGGRQKGRWVRVSPGEDKI